MTRSRLAILIPLLLAVVLVLSGLANTDLWGSDETRYALLAREMVDRGDYSRLTVNGEPYRKKPPLVPWMMVAVSRVTGEIGSLEARLPAGLAGVGTVLLVFAIGSVLFDRRTGFWGAVLLAAAPAFVKEARIARMDMVLTFFTTLSLLGFVLWERRRVPDVVAFVLVFLPLAFGVLTKWAAPAFVLPPILIYLLATGQRGRIPWLASLVGLAVAFSPLLVFSDFGEYGKVIGGEVHKQPFYYHLVRLPLVALPAALFLPGTIAVFLRRNLPTSERRGLALLLVWVLTGLVLLSFSTGKRTNYLDPLIPAGVLAGAWFVARVADGAASGRLARFLRWPVAALFAGAVLGGLLLALRPSLASRSEEIELARGLVVATGVLAAILGAAGIFAAFRARAEIAVAILVALVAAGALGRTLILDPMRNPSQSVRPITDVFVARAAPDAKLGYAVAEGSSGGSMSMKWVFHSGRHTTPVPGPRAVLAWLDAEREHFIIVRRRDFDDLLAAAGGSLPARVRIEADSTWDENDFLLLSNRRGEGEPTLLGPGR